MKGVSNSEKKGFSIENNILGNTPQEIATRVVVDIGENLEVSQELEGKIAKLKPEVTKAVAEILIASIEKGAGTLEVEIANDYFQDFL